MSVLDGKSNREIAEILKVDRKTVAVDLEKESERLAEENAARRETDQARHLAQIADLYQRSLRNSDKSGTGGLAAAAKCLEMKARILGLDQPSRFEAGLADLLAAIAVPPDA